MLLRVSAALVAMALAAPAAAACYADYKASKEDPLRLHYGVIELPDSACDPGSAEREARDRLRSAGWKLLGIVSLFGPEGLEERRESAGDFFLRY